MRLSLIISLLIYSLSIWAVSPTAREQIKKRIKPIGQVSVAKQESPQSAEQTSAGKMTYEQYCTVCHQEGVAGAPRFQNANDWKPRLDKQSLDELVATASKGLNAMPMKGTCMKCTDEELKNAIQYMLPKS